MIRLTPTIKEIVARQRPGFSLESELYCDPRAHQLDLEAVWFKHWLYAGHDAQIPKAGDYFLYEIGNESVIVMRGDDNEVRALANVCRHRGSRLCTDETGCVKRIVCPYHQWVYDKDGTLLSAKLMDEGFDPKGYGLRPVHLRTLPGGFLFVCFAPTPPPFDDFAEEVAPHLAFYDLENLMVGATARYTVRANWKLMAENFRECYHCGVGHPEYCQIIPGSNMTGDTKRAAEYKEAKRREWAAKGVPTQLIGFDPGVYRYCERYPYDENCVTMSLDGKPVAAPILAGKQSEVGDIGAFSIVQYPNFWLDINPDYVWTMRITPLAADTCDVSLHWLVRGGQEAGLDFDVARLMAFWKTTGEQDWKLCEDTQAGVKSRFYQPFPYAAVDGGPAQFEEWYLGEATRYLAQNP